MRAPRSQHSELVASATAAAAFAALARHVDTPRPPRVDRAVHALAVTRHHRLLELAQLPVEIGGLPGVYIPLAALVARRLRRRHADGGDTIVGAAIAGWLAVRAMRLLYHRQRPPRPHRRPKRESSFPSGHTTGLTSVAVAAAVVLAREHVISPAAARALAVGVPLVVGFNRVYVREHWLTDVVGGWLLGGAVAMSCLALGPTRRRRRRHRVASVRRGTPRVT